MIFLLYWIVVICLFNSVTDGVVIGYDRFNLTMNFDDLPATFGSSIGSSGFKGYLIVASPEDACTPINLPPTDSSGIDNSSLNFIALIKRGNCDFAIKVLNAQNAKYDAAIVFNDDSDELVRMNSDKGSVSQQVVIPSVFVGLTTGFYLGQDFIYNPTSSVPYVLLESDGSPFSLKYYLIPFCTVIGTCFLCLCLFMMVRACQQRRRQRRNRLSRQRLKQLPVKQFTKGDEYDVCAICLDDYEEGEKLRILPCRHAYHCACVDPWLTSSKRVCPLCKRRVLSDDESSNSDEEYDDQTSDEQVPLLQSSEAASANSSRYATGFSRSNPFSRSYSTSTDESGIDRLSGSPTHDELSVVVVQPDNQESPEFHSVPTSPPDRRLVALANAPLLLPANLPSSVASTDSIEAYSCQSSSILTSSDTLDSDDSDIIVLRSGTANRAEESTSAA